MGGGGGGSAPSEPIPSSNGGQPNYIPTNQSGMDTAYQNLMSAYLPGAQSLANLTPSAAQAATSVAQNPYTSQVVPGALQAQSIAQQTGVPEMQGGSQALYAAGNQALPYAAQVLQQGFDPQQQLYNQQYQQMMDQQNASAASNGLGGSPYAAGLENQAATNFNTQWQANQLANMGSAANTYNSLMNQTGADYTGAANLANQGTQAALGAGSLPYSAYNMPLASTISALSSAGGAGSAALGPATTGMNAAGAYLGLGNNASSSYNSAVNNAYSQDLGAYNANQQANQAMLGGIGNLAGGIMDFGQGNGSLFGQSLWGGAASPSDLATF